MNNGFHEITKGYYEGDLIKGSYVWYEENWKHQDYEHQHLHYQLTYVQSGYQYFYVGNKMYLVPQNHVIWIPSGIKHMATSESTHVKLMIMLFKTTPEHAFYNSVRVFPAAAVLKEMVLYAAKWSKSIEDDTEQAVFLSALLHSLPSLFKEGNSLEIPVPFDSRLINVCNHIHINYTYGIDFDELTALAKMSMRSLQRIFKQETGITVQKYLQLVRILKSIALMDTKKFTLTEIAFKVGYKSLSAFTTAYKSIMKSIPKLRK